MFFPQNVNPNYVFQEAWPRYDSTDFKNSKYLLVYDVLSSNLDKSTLNRKQRTG